MTDQAQALKLRVFEPAEPEPAEFHLGGQEAVIGRDETADIMIEHGSISHRHGVLRPAGAGYAYTDQGSRNGSALVRGGAAPVSLTPGETIPVGPGDVLLLGDASAPVRLVIEAGAAAFSAPSSVTRTVVASAPLADLLHAGDDGLVTLAAQALAAETPAALAEAAFAHIKRLVPRADGVGVALWGAGLRAEAGQEVPGAVREAILTRGEVVLFEQGGDALPMTESVVQVGLRAALAAPLMAGGATLGVMAAWSSVGQVFIPAAAVPPMSVAATLVALSAAQLAVRARGRARQRELEEDNRRLRGDRSDTRVVEPIGTSSAFTDALQLARNVAPADVPVLLLGETGSGKEVLARNLHAWSRRAAKPFVAFNCAAVPESLIESELFGHVRGAFTGAGADRKGLFEEADGGTIFLDEIGEMPAVMQAKLLRVLQDGEVRRVGASRTVRVDVRVVSATHRDLPVLVESGSFRADLMYRLNAVTLRIPPLRERGDDISLLAHFLLGRACERARKTIPGFAPDALWALTCHDYPGNVRELENEVQRAVALTPDGAAIRATAFSQRLAQRGPAPEPAGAEPTTFKAAVAAAERAIIGAALTRADGNVSQAARALGLTRPGLYKIMERVGLR